MTVRLRYMADINPSVPLWEELPDEARLTFLPLEAVWPDNMDFSQFRTKAEVSSGYTRFQEGDIVVPKITPTFQADRSTLIKGMPTLVGAGTTELHVIRTHQGVEPRFIDHLISSRPFLMGGEAQMIGVAGQKRVPDSWLRDYPVPIVDLRKQRAIADFLDAETARIDALVAKKRRMIEVFREVGWLALETALSAHGIVLPDSVDPALLRGAPLPPGWTAPKLSSVLLQLTNGYVGPTRDILRDEGVRYIQGLHLKQGVIDFERRPYYVEDKWHEAHPRTALRSGDVLIVQTGDIGQVAVVPDGYGPANCHALLIARANPDFISGPYLGAYLQSRFGYHSLVRVATGALHPHLEFSIRDVPVLVPPKALQSLLVSEVSERQSTIDRMTTALTRQIKLLAEHRQALLTAAVTGELDIAESLAEAAS